MELNELYTQYGQLSIQAEIINNQMLEVKTQIANKLNAQKQQENNKA